ncbi:MULTISPECIES: NAD-binding protein [Halolamina]|uniref:Voltage-gated potassium channel n=1 Tax=Halolamina pelagica TaxID=699431 RepID=A0A1I5THH5_9EURY|nr:MULTISPECIES: NAD-binding protein [Halolamina]NHX37354.1 potassium channel protein [Halolamina sp. R1-12]SFP82493.1 voltage-gated potassium channel [Halolamina pelagica]
MQWDRDWIGVRASIWLTFAVAALSVATGIINISTTTVAGPLAEYVPPMVRQTAGFTGVLTGFLTLAGAFMLRKRYRAGWYLTVAMFPVTAVQGLLQASNYSYPLVALSLLALPVVALNYRTFDHELDLTTTQLAALGALVAAQVYGTAGTYALREGFQGVNSLIDAFYYTLVTGSTVGYGDIYAQTQQARLFAMSAILLSVASFAIALGVVLTPMIEARFSAALGRMTEQQLDTLENHVLVLGYGDLTEPILEELESQTKFVVVTEDETVTRRLTNHDVHVLTANPSDEEPLKSAGIDRARAVIAATNNDANDALSILTARELNPDIHIAVGVTQRENVSKLKRAGADTVISPAVIGGHLLVEAAMGRGDSEREASDLLGESE